MSDPVRLCEMGSWDSVDSGHCEVRLGGWVWRACRPCWEVSLLWLMKPTNIY